MFHRAQQQQPNKVDKDQTNSEGQKEMSTQENKTGNTQPRNVEIPQAGNAGGTNYAPRPAQGLPGQFQAGGNAQQSTSQTHSATNAVNNASSGRRLVIGSGITMSGEIEACDHLIVEGTVEAALKGANVLDIAETGAFFGKVEIQEATVAGRFDGDITVKGRLTVKASGVIKGNISYEELAVEAGATLQGTLKPYTAETAQSSPQHKASAKDTKSSAKSTAKKEAANEGSELPFADKTAAAAE